MEDFRIESAEHRQSIITELMELETNPDPEKEHRIIETIFREIHSLKGAARAVNLGNVERLCQAAETVFTMLKRDELALSTELVDSLHSFINMLNILLTRMNEPFPTEEKNSTVTGNYKLH
jgi:two-component system chemotaxis sensor kinase CheA